MAASFTSMGCLQGPVVCRLQNISTSPESLDIPKTVIVELSRDAEDTAHGGKCVLINFRVRLVEGRRKVTASGFLAHLSGRTESHDISSLPKLAQGEFWRGYDKLFHGPGLGHMCHMCGGWTECLGSVCLKKTGMRSGTGNGETHIMAICHCVWLSNI